MLASLYTVPELRIPYQGYFLPAGRASLPHRHIFRAKKDLSFTLKSLPSVSDLYGHETKAETLCDALSYELSSSGSFLGSTVGKAGDPCEHHRPLASEPALTFIATLVGLVPLPSERWHVDSCTKLVVCRPHLNPGGLRQMFFFPSSATPSSAVRSVSSRDLQLHLFF